MPPDAGTENELAALRAEVAQLRADLDRVLMFLDQKDYPDEPRPEFGAVEFQSLCIRHSRSAIPVSLCASEEESGLFLYDNKHCLRAELSLNVQGEAGLIIYNSKGERIALLGEGPDGGGLVGVHGADGAPRACMRSEQNDGVVSVVDKQGRPLAFMRGRETGGMSGVMNNQQRPAALIQATDGGGMMTVHEPSGQMMASMAAVPDGALLMLNGEQGAPGATLATRGEAGGVMAFYEANGETKAIAP